MVAEAWMKLALLSDGVSIEPDFLDWFSNKEQFVERRNFYNTPNWMQSGNHRIPQEMRIGDLVVAINSYNDTTWRLTMNGGTPVLHNFDREEWFPVNFIEDLQSLKNNSNLARSCNLYGGSALAFFTPRACYFFADGNECKFCSLEGTAKEQNGYAGHITATELEAAIACIVKDDIKKINQIMIVGGNDRDLDRGFNRHTHLAYSVEKVLNQNGLLKDISVHVATMPPANLDLIENLKNLSNPHIMFNLEVWDSKRFEEVTPGKDRDYGREKLINALKRLVSVVGPYRAHSILIAGLETPDSTLAGAKALGEIGVSPIINVYHSDRHSQLGLSFRPSYRDLLKISVNLQELYLKYQLQPYWKGCGRNAIDFEASRGMFDGLAPDYGK